MSTSSEATNPCLDLLRITWNSESGEMREQCVNLLGVSKAGGLLHGDDPIPPGTRIQLHIAEGCEVEAEVKEYEQDEFGFYLTIAVKQPWYPDLFQPDYVLPETLPAHHSSEPDGHSHPARVLPSPVL